MKSSIFGVDINEEAIRVASFSLSLAMCDFLDPRSIWDKLSFPRLLDNNLISSDFFDEDKSFNNRKFDVIIGNPPWQSNITRKTKEYLKKANRVIGDKQIAQAFSIKCSELCKQSGIICLLMPSKGLLFNRSDKSRTFRANLFSYNNVLAIINLSVYRKFLFDHASAPAAAIIYTPKKEEISQPIVYCTPKPIYTIEDIRKFSIDPTDICRIPCDMIDDDRIWKIAMWGAPRDLELIGKMQSTFAPMATFIEENRMTTAEGLEYTNKNKSLAAVYARGKLQTIVSFSGDLVLFLVIFIFSEGKAGNISLLFAVRPMINFFNYINITIISTRENLDIISDFLTYNEKEEYDQRNLLSSSTAHGDSSDGGCRGVEICNLSFSYNQKNIFDDFSFKFSYGNIYEIRGPRGIGKSTLLKIIYNLLSPSNGEVLIDGEANYRIHKLENQIFYLPSSTTPFILDMESNILLGKSPPAEFLDIINTLGLGAIIKDSCENLSTGEQLRVAMARGLISKKNIFLLDEFNANLDNKTSDQIVQMLLKKAKNGALIILVNHKSSIPGAIILELGL